MVVNRAGSTNAVHPPTRKVMQPFDIRGPLPVGTAILEASAGTGKTHTIGSLLTRYIAEGVATLDQILVVTFGRTASQELRERIRGQLVVAERALAAGATADTDTDTGIAPTGADTLVQLLTAGPPDEVAARHRRLIRALADFDAATIATTHQFCQQVLTELGVAGDTDQGVELVEDLDEVIIDVVDDLYLRMYGVPQRAGEPTPDPPFTRTQALELGRKAIADPQAALEPIGVDPNSVPGLRRRFAQGVRTEVERRKKRLGILGYDDLLSRVADSLSPDAAGARDRLRGRWQFVLVDEFQDTDPVQWKVLKLAFDGFATMVLVGDPKQSIYAFRGGDIFTYLDAARTATSSATLGENYRSDAPLVAALQATLGDAELGDPDIVARPVRAAGTGSRLSGTPHEAPFRLRVLRRDQLGIGATRNIPVGRARDRVALDLTADIAQLLGSGAQFENRPLAAGDVAVLVATHKQAGLIRDALAAQRIPVVIAGGGSVYATAASDDWLVLLEALEQPHSARRARSAALTSFLGYTADQLIPGATDTAGTATRQGGPGVGLADTLADTLTDTLTGLMHHWSALLADRGVAALLEVMMTDFGLAGRLLAEQGGERMLTDLRHIGQDLHATMVNGGLAAPGLTEWIRQRRADADWDHNPERTRRLDSDRAAVQVVTLHASKGLQYPVVYLPFAFDRWVASADLLLYHDQQGRRMLDVGGPNPADRKNRQTREVTAASELAGESLRLLYVGLTRAQSQVVIWWAPTTNTPASALHRLLFGRGSGTGAIPDETRLPTDDVAAAQLAQWQARGGPTIEAAVPPTNSGSVLPEAGTTDPERLGARDFERALDTEWRRTSYSALTATDRPHGHHGAAGGIETEPEVGQTDDEQVQPAATILGGTGGAAAQGEIDAAAMLSGALAQSSTALLQSSTALLPSSTTLPQSSMMSMPRGTAFGTLVHAVLEHVDPRSGDLGLELRTHCAEQLSRFRLSVGVDELVGALLPIYTTPLGPLASEVTLADIPISDRLAELTFEMPLTGGDHPRGGLHLKDLATVWAQYVEPADPMFGYGARLRSAELADRPLRGYLTGSLDAVLRLPGPRYLIVDYKTNWLGESPDDELTTWDYRPSVLGAAMAGSDYPLQAALYSVALHRFLRWRQAEYDPERHLGGLLYLFVRGMVGPLTPRQNGEPCGVFGWQPPVGLVLALSDLLDRGRAS